MDGSVVVCSRHLENPLIMSEYLNWMSIGSLVFFISCSISLGYCGMDDGILPSSIESAPFVHPLVPTICSSGDIVNGVPCAWEKCWMFRSKIPRSMSSLFCMRSGGITTSGVFGFCGVGISMCDMPPDVFCPCIIIRSSFQHLRCCS
jgi:hypothetical protein